MNATASQRTARLPEHEGMPLTDVYGLRLARKLDTVNAHKLVEGERGLVWKWDIAARANGRKAEMRYLVREINDREHADLFLKPVGHVIKLLLGERQQWTVTDLSNLLLCSQEHIHALLRAKALVRAKAKTGQPGIRVDRESLESFFTKRLR